MRRLALSTERGSVHPLAWLAPAAIALRLLLFLGRGDYVAFDEGWYLLLGRNLLSGDGFTLTGLRHYTLSPLFPILAGALDYVLGDPIRAGRVVAAVTSGLLVVPCWSIFRRLGGRRTALLGCGVVALLPSLAPFVAPRWIGWDLWVGAEPVAHLFLYSGVALVLRALEHRRTGDWLFAGGALALAYLARPEMIIVSGLLGLGAAGILLTRRAPRAWVQPAACALAFALTAAPYWVYLRDTMGRWSLTGRGVQIDVGFRSGSDERGGDRADDSPGAIIERMLWEGADGAYVHRLFALDPSGERLASGYWGVPPATELAAAPQARPVPSQPRGPTGGRAVAAEAPRAPAPERARPAASKLVLYARALATVVPGPLWCLVAIGLLAPRWRRSGKELLAFGPLVATSGLIAAVVAVDPRTQLFLAPALAFYIGRGARALGVWLDRRVPRHAIQRGFLGSVLAAVVLAGLALENARRLYMSLSVGSAHQIVAAENRRAGEGLRAVVPPDEPVMSWHPAVALHARRDWRVLPIGSFSEIVHYAAAARCRYVVLSVYYPSPLTMKQMPREYLVIRLPDEEVRAERWHIEVTQTRENYAIGTLRPE